MEESLKARLIGAAVLVAVAVLLIPELLSGRKAVDPVAEEGAGPRGTRTFTIELGNGPGQATRTTTSAMPPAASPPAPEPAVEATERQADAQAAAGVEPPAESTVEPDAPRSEPVTVAAEPAVAKAEPVKKDEPVKAAASGGWVVQVGAFGSTATARGLVKDLTAAGFPAHISPVTRGGKTLHRVRVGPVAEKATAEQLSQRLKARGLPATVVQND